MKKILPILLMVLGLVGGAGAGLTLRPATESANADCAAPDQTAHDAPATDAHGAPDEAHPAPDCDPLADATTHAPAASTDGHGGDAPAASVEYVRLERQFVIPVLTPERVRALVVLSLSIETDPGGATTVYAQEPKLRDAFLQVLFRHANTGGFDGAFTTGQKMTDLRSALRAASAEVLGALSRDVLVIDVVRQDI